MIEIKLVYLPERTLSFNVQNIFCLSATVREFNWFLSGNFAFNCNSTLLFPLSQRVMCRQAPLSSPAIRREQDRSKQKAVPVEARNYRLG
jgi:hypothetical protein